MYIFCDTEFTDFKNMDMISVGLITEDGQHEFYAELTDYNTKYSSDFVKQVVVPLLNPLKYGDERSVVKQRMCAWIDELPGANITFVVDYVGDWNLIKQLLLGYDFNKNVRVELLHPSFVNMLLMRGFHNERTMVEAETHMMKKIGEYFDQDPRQHHSLVDAKATRYGWVQAYEFVKMRTL